MESQFRKAKTHKGRHVLQEFEQQQLEQTRNTLFLKGLKTSKNTQFVSDILKSLKKNQSIFLTKKNNILPFEQKESIVFLCQKNKTPLFFMQNSTKKRPNSIIVARVFNDAVLEIVDFEVTNVVGDIHKAFSQLSDVTRPIFICNGEQFDFDDDQMRIRNLIHDLIFIQTQDQKINIERNINLAVMMSSTNNADYNFRFYKIENQTSIPLDLGFDLKINRKLLEQKSTFNQAIEQRKKERRIWESKSQKNISKNNVGEQLGRIHVKQQNIKNLKIRKSARMHKKSEI